MSTCRICVVVGLVSAALAVCSAEQVSRGAAAAAPISAELKLIEPLVRSNPPEAVRRLDAYLARHPDDAQAHLWLSRSIRYAVEGLSATDVAMLERAAGSARRALTLTQDRDVRIGALESLTDIYGPVRLKRPADVLEPARQIMALGNNGAMEHMTVVFALRDLKRYDEAVDLLHRARGAVNIKEHKALVVLIKAFVDRVPTLSQAQVQGLVTDLTEMAEADPERTGPSARAAALRIRANRLETDPVRQRALLDEADLWAKISDARSAAALADLKAKIKALEQLRSTTTKK